MAFSPDTALKYLQRAHKQNRLAHAYLITGPAGSGKQALANDLARFVNKTESQNGAGVIRIAPESGFRRDTNNSCAILRFRFVNEPRKIVRKRLLPLPAGPVIKYACAARFCLCARFKYFSAVSGEKAVSDFCGGQLWEPR